MANSVQRYVNISRYVYLCMLTVYTILREVVPLQNVIGSSLLSYGFFGLGLAVVAAGVAVDRSYLKVRNIWILVAFIGACILSMVINFRYELVSNVKAVGWMCIFFFLLYPYGVHRECDRKRGVHAVFITAVVTFSVLVALSLPMYFLNVDYTYLKETGTVSNQGFSNQYMRLWGVFQDANSAAVYASVGLVMAIYLFAKYRNVIIRCLLGLCAVMLIMFIVLTGSRTAELVSLIACGWAALYLALTRWGKGWKKIAFSAAACLMAVVFCYGLMTGVQLSLPYAQRAAEQITKSHTVESVHSLYEGVYRFGQVELKGTEKPEEPPESDDEVESLDRIDLEGKDDVSNGRFVKWMDALEIFSKSPVVGASPRGISAFGKDHCPDNTISKYGYAAHNFLLEILAGTGLVGFVIAMVILFRTMLVVVKAALKKEFDGTLLAVSSMALMLVCASVLVSDLFFILTFGGVVFWLCAGIINGMETINTVEGV